MWHIGKKKKRKMLSEAMTVRLDMEDFRDLTDENVLTGHSSIVGTRENQQDAMFVERNAEKNYTLAIVCDGMGGLDGGAIASQSAVSYIAGEVHDVADRAGIHKELLRITRDADKVIADLKDELGNEIKAGTTMVAVFIKDGILHWVSVGDSKLYLMKQGILKCITNEHNYSFMVRQNAVEGKLEFDPKVRKDALVSYLGIGGLTYVDTNQAPVTLQDGDMLLLCSDGLYRNLSEDMICELMKEKADVNRIAENLTTAALLNAKGSQDNTTAIVLRYKFS
ncbi:MAG: PP2C family serine/threonine-protein phosphatase [Anaerovoracaceae bacterium]|nr:PP2C family serine/threonine-protein phosphatase [Anaerovoracaceae bacterium]